MYYSLVMLSLQVQQFAEDISDYLYGFSEDTLKSLMLSILPSEGYVYKPHPFDTEPDQTKSPEDISSLLLRKITHAMHLSAGFNINVVRYFISSYILVLHVFLCSMLQALRNLSWTQDTYFSC